MTAIYLLDAVGLLNGPVDLPVIPGLGRQLPGNAIELPDVLPDPAPGNVWALVDGQPRQLADRRGTVYRTDSGAEQQHIELGELPAGLTIEPRPSAFHVWSGETWVMDEAAQTEAVRQSAMAAIAARRYAEETRGIVLGGTMIDTGRDSQALITGAALAATLDPAYVCRWKTGGGFVELSAAQIVGMATAVRAHVQACFDREAELLAEVEAGAFTDAILDSGWPD